MGSQIKTVSMDDETVKIIEDRRKADPSFNLSEFIRISLINENGENNMLPIEIIEKNLDEADHKIKIAENNKSHWEKMRRNYQIKKEMELKLKEEEEEKEKQQMERLKEKEKNIKNAFKEEMGREMTEFEYEEYSNHKTNIWAFCDLLKGEKE